MIVEHYLQRAKLKERAYKAQHSLVITQTADAANYVTDGNSKVTCGCGKTHAVESLFRCYFCGIWFCEQCAKDHFGEEECQL